MQTMGMGLDRGVTWTPAQRCAPAGQKRLREYRRALRAAEQRAWERATADVDAGYVREALLKKDGAMDLFFSLLALAVAVGLGITVAANHGFILNWNNFVYLVRGLIG